MQLTIPPDQIAKFEREFKRLSKEKTEAMKRAVETNTIKMTSEAKKNVPVYQGRLRASIRTIMKNSGYSGRTWTDVAYAPAVEFGTKSKTKIPPEIQEFASEFQGFSTNAGGDLLEQIKKWTRKKGIPEAAAYPIMIKLLKIGQSPQPFLYPAFKNAKKRLLDDIKKIMKK